MRGFSVRVGRWQFAPGVWPSLAALFFFALTLSLGNWQIERATTKRVLQTRYDAAQNTPAIHMGENGLDVESAMYRKLEMRGRFLPAHQIVLDNRVHAGVVGYHVLTPLQIEHSSWVVLVNRGWLAAGATREHLPTWPTPTGVVQLEGLATPPQSRYFELGKVVTQGRVWQNLDFAAYTRQTGLKLQTLLLLQTSHTHDGLVRSWPRPDAGVSTHVSYAWQWYSLALTLLVLWLGLNLSRSPLQPDGLPISDDPLS
ncbi:MAG: SURF1 family protein [Thiobacillus sp.]